MITKALAVAGVLLALLLPAEALAATVPVWWTNATQNTDNSMIPLTGPGSLTSTTIEYGTCAARNPDVFGTKQGQIVAAAPASTINLSLTVIQEYCLRAFHTNTLGQISAFSNVAFKTLITIPGPPSGLTTTSPTAYNVVKVNDGFVMVPVGTIPVGTQCDATQSVNGYNVIPASSVTWSGNIKPVVVVGRCG